MRGDLTILALICAIIFVFSGVVSAADVPTANFTSNDTSGNAPLSIEFKDTSTGNPTSWDWDFGDNETSTEQNPTHVYKSLGNYSVKLNASNSEGSSIKTGMIHVTNASAFSNYRDTNIYVANDAGIKYDVQDGVVNTNTAGITYTYVNGTYFVSFRQDNGGLNPLHISTNNSGIDLINTTNQSGTFYITFSGGVSVMPEAILMLAVNGTISPNFTVHITSSGYTWDLCVPSTKNNSTTNNLTYVVGALNETFDASDFIYTSYYKLCSSADYPIYYGQNMTDTNNTFMIMFIDLYAGCLQTGTDNGSIKVDYSFTGLNSENTAAFNIYGWYSASAHGTGIIMSNSLTTGTTGQYRSSGYLVQGIDPPLANFTSNITTGLPQLNVQFTDLSTGNATSWLWNFGDGTNSTEQNPVHKYSQLGIYTVTLTVTNDGGNNTITKVGYIKVIDIQNPKVNINLRGGLFNKLQNIVLTAIDDSGDVTIYYTTNGSTPTISSKKYTGPIQISSTTTLKFLAIDKAGNKSPIYVQRYIIDRKSPKVVRTTPKRNVHAASLTSTIIIKFSERIKKTVNWSKIYIRNLNTGKKVSIKKWVSGNKLYIKMKRSRLSLNWYRVYIPKSAVKDRAGNKLLTKFVFKFKTARY